MSYDVSSVVKRALPSHVCIGDDANSLLSAQSLELVRMLHLQAEAKMILENRAKLDGEDIVWALKSFGMEDYSNAIGTLLEKYRASLDVTADDDSRR